MAPTELYFTSIALLCSLLFKAPNDGWWKSTVLWAVRIVSFSLLMRTHIVPWLLATMSRHIRVRSVSFRSIRELYIRKGNRTCHIERVGWSWSGGDRQLVVKIEGLTLKIYKPDSSSPAPTHRRSFTLANLSRTVRDHRFWKKSLKAIHGFFDPFFRPLLRAYVVAMLRVTIRRLPRLMAALSFEMPSPRVIFVGVPGAQIVSDKVHFHATLAFTHVENVDPVVEQETLRRRARSYSVTAWKSRLMTSFRRSLDRALEKTQGNATFALNIQDVRVMVRSPDAKGQTNSSDVLSVGGVTSLGASISFNPKTGKLETHSLQTTLEVGECRAELNSLLSFLEVLKEFKQQRPPTLSYPRSPTNPFFVPSPLSSPRTSLWTPMLSPLNTASLSPLTSAPVMSPIAMSPTSSSSPFFDAISSSLRPRRPYHQPCMRLRNIRNNGMLYFLKTVDVSIFSIKLISRPRDDLSTGNETYEAVIRNVGFDASLSNPKTNPLHRRWLGTSDKLDTFESEIYALSCSVRQMTVHRIMPRETLRLLTIGVVDAKVLASQWPSPWLVTSPFIGGDPNAPLIVLQVHVEGIELTEQAEYLSKVADRIPDRSPSTPESETPPLPPAPLSMPRVAFEMHCGPICGRLVSGSPGDASKVLELRTDGFTASLDSRFIASVGARKYVISDMPSVQLRMSLTFAINIKPTFIRVRSGWSRYKGVDFVSLSSSDAGFSEDPALLSTEGLEVTGQGDVLAALTDDMQNAPYLDLSSLIIDVFCTTDALCVELWNPSVIDGILEITHLLPTAASKQAVGTQRPLLDRLPPGLWVTVSFARFVVFVTSPDISPNDVMELSRGVAIRATGMSFQYCSMRSSHAYRFNGIPTRSQTRHKLLLPEEQIVEALAAARTSTIANTVSAFVTISVPDLSVRSALSNQYATDDPLIAERDDPTMDALEFLHVLGFKTEISLTGKRNSATPVIKDACQVSIRIPHTRATFQHVHVYSMLLAVQALKNLVPARTTRPPPIPKASSSILYTFSGLVKTFQVLFVLRKQRAACRLETISADSSSDGSIGFRCHRAVVWVALPSRINRWQDDDGEKWEELLSFHKLAVQIPAPSISPVSILVESHAARMHIPHGYVLSDLILDVSVTLKAVRHLFRLTGSGRYFPMPTPEPEGAKSMPNLSIRISSLCLEAADDPLEVKLGLIWRASLDASKTRVDREEAFLAKAGAVLAAESTTTPPADETIPVFNFTPKHSISVEEARKRLQQVHSVDWVLRHTNFKTRRSQEQERIAKRFYFASPVGWSKAVPNIVNASPVDNSPPLLRAMITNLSLTATPPSFSLDRLPEFLGEQGSLPRETQFTLLIPMHINFTLSSLRISLRDYPLPLAEICALPDATVAVWEFDTDLVVAEELGTDLSVDWVDCPIVGTQDGSAPLSISVPKTIMPVKTYANPEINVTTPAPTIFSWGVSYGAATQDMMRVLDTLSSAPRDPSPGVGFWDKFRLILHWSVRATFKGEVRYQMKGLRDPYETRGSGAGFVLAWEGHPKLLIARKNDQGELVQVVSDSMLIAVPNLKRPSSLDSCEPSRASEPPPPFRKICAKFRSGVRFGVGFVLERTCGPECTHCSGSAFHRHCRFYTFKPHFQVMLEKKSSIPVKHGQNDSYSEFRSDFIHLSISLTSATRTSSPHSYRHPSSLHLTPKAFTHFYSWWGLFENVLSLPIRQGNYYPRRALSPKFTRHLATIKYRIVVPQLFVMHGYTDESRETWADSVTPWVGVKGMIDELQVDMHQRDQETTVPGLLPGSTKILRRKPFYAAELVMKGLDLRAILATFTEPLKQHVTMSAPPERSNYRARKDLPTTDPSSKWYNPDDFVETDWSPSSTPSLHVLPIATSARFMYFKRNSSVLEDTSQSSKFGNEDSHQCLLGKEPSAPDVQISIVRARISELKAMIDKHDGPDGQPQQNGELSSEKKISLLEKYISVLQDMQTRLGQDADVKNPTYYQMPSDTVSADEWAEFDNVYHIHCPRISMDSAIRDIMMQYYYCSRARRGVEYHMATRAVKFIRDQAEATLSTSAQSPSDKSSGHTNTAQAAATALRKLLIGDHSESSNISEELGSAVAPNNLKPLDGWSSGVSLKKSHCFLLLKPQVVLRHKAPGVEEQTCIVAAHQAKMQSFDIMDDSNIEDPISGKVMSRGYTVVSGLQTFAPTKVASSEGGCVPLEVLIDFRCESNEFDRLVPQTDATFHYDKFNRLRLRNNVISVATREPTNKSDIFFENHLQDQTDLMQVTCPRFTVTASDKHFQTISNIVTKLLLFSDAAHKTRLEKIETLLFTYDFTDLTSAAKVISDLQNRLRDAAETERQAEGNIYNINASGKLELCKLRAHIFILTEELGLLFDAIKLAQDRDDDRVDSKSAVLLRASSSEISWRMLDDQRDLLTKLVAQDIDYAWLSRQDSSTINNLSLGNLQAFDGSRNAVWTEIISKYDEPANHPLLKKGLFLLANWAVLPPVGGITIYESFELMFHPLRLQIDARVGRRIMEYVWPARRERKALEGESVEEAASSLKAATSMRSSLDIPRTPRAQDAETMLAPPKLRRLHVSRSFTDLRSTAAAPSSLQAPKIRSLQSTRSSEALRQNTAPGAVEHRRPKSRAGTRSGSTGPAPKAGDAAEMRTRSSQKTFVYVRIASLNMLLSIMKEDSFLCRDARISTRDLEYRNQTSSFEELVDQFIPADMSWKGWVKMAFHQPLVPVIPVARELISKTKWMASKTHLEPNASPPKRHRIKAAPPDNVENDTHMQSGRNTRARTPSPHRTLKKLLRPRPQTPPPPLPHFTPGPITSEPEPLEEEGQGRPGRPNARSRVLSIFHRGPKKSNSSTSSTSFSSSSLRVSEEPDDQSPHPTQ